MITQKFLTLWLLFIKETFFFLPSYNINKYDASNLIQTQKKRNIYIKRAEELFVKKNHNLHSFSSITNNKMICYLEIKCVSNIFKQRIYINKYNF